MLLKPSNSIQKELLIQEVIDNEDYHELNQEIKLNIFDLERRISKPDVDIEKELATFELTRKAFKAFEINTSVFSDMNSEKKSQTLKKLLSNSTLKHENSVKSLSLQYKKPYDVIVRADYTELCPELLLD